MLLLSVHPDCVRAARYSPSAGLRHGRGAQDHVPAFTPSQWMLGNWGSTIFPFQVDFMHSTLAQKASTLCFITDGLS